MFADSSTPARKRERCTTLVAASISTECTLALKTEETLHGVEMPSETVDMAVPTEGAVVLKRKEGTACHESLPNWRVAM